MDQKIYIDLLKKMLTDYHRVGSVEYKPLYSNNPDLKLWFLMALNRSLRVVNLAICKVTKSKIKNRTEGKDWPPYADTMIGLKRLNNIENCINKIVKDDIQGDLIETGVWRGGASIFMKALLKINNVTDKVVWVADSFEGLPEPNDEKYNADRGDILYTMQELAISLEIVKNNFEKYDLLDDQVKFLKGWFKDTLPSAPIQKLSLIRLDGDMYESTMDGLVNLYPKLSEGGFIIIDDWGAIEACKQAVVDYRDKYGITDEIRKVDWTGVYWRKGRTTSGEV